MNTTQATLPATEGMLNSNDVRSFMSGSARKFESEQLPSGSDVEIENRLRNLEQTSAMIKGMDCRSRFSNNGIGQVKIRMRLKQVTGLVSG